MCIYFLSLSLSLYQELGPRPRNAAWWPTIKTIISHIIITSSMYNRTTIIGSQTE